MNAVPNAFESLDIGLREAVRAYMQEGQLNDSYLGAVLRNDLYQTVSEKRVGNLQQPGLYPPGCTGRLVDWLYANDPDKRCWGDTERVMHWLSVGWHSTQHYQRSLFDADE